MSGEGRRSAVVFGARNLGRAVIENLAADGWSVVGIARSEETLAGVARGGGVPLAGAMLAGAGRSADARIETQCTDCSAPLGLAVDAGRLTTDVAGAVAHFAVPAARWWADIVFT